MPENSCFHTVMQQKCMEHCVRPCARPHETSVYDEHWWLFQWHIGRARKDPQEQGGEGVLSRKALWTVWAWVVKGQVAEWQGPDRVQCQCMTLDLPWEQWGISEKLQRRINSVQSLSHVQLLVTPWTASRQASLSITNSQSLLKLMSIESVIPSNYLILCHPLRLLPSVFPSIRVFSSGSVLHIRWPKY